MRATVVGSKRSRLYSKKPKIRRGESHSPRVKSNRELPSSTQIGVTVRSGSAIGVYSESSSRKLAWTSGGRLLSRSGLSASRSFPNGRSW